MNTILDNVKAVQDAVAQAALRSGRQPEDVTLVAASKMNDTPRLREAYDAGIRVFGENRVQELVEKNAQGAYEGAGLHFIGHLQTNKVKFVAGVCDLIQSVDSEALVRQIGRRAAALGKVQDILIEVNIGREPGKSGVLTEELEALLGIASGEPGVHVRGLMAIPPVTENPALSRKFFDAMHQLYVDTAAKKYDNIDMCFLSMGMSADYAEAICAGATMVRVGTAIFGSRHYV